jgi:hypothetical protein
MFCGIVTGERSDPKAGSKYGSRVDGWKVKILCGEVAAFMWTYAEIRPYRTIKMPVCAAHAQTIEPDQLRPLTAVEQTQANGDAKVQTEGRVPAPIVTVPTKRRYDFES